MALLFKSAFFPFPPQRPPSPSREEYLTVSSGVSFQEDDSRGASVETEYLNNLCIISIQCVCSGIIEEVKLSWRGCAVCP